MSQEGLCEECGREYPTPWFTSNDVWNRVAGSRHFLCMHCFVKRAEKSGIVCTGWELVPENLSQTKEK